MIIVSLIAISLMLCSTVKCQTNATCFDQEFEEWFTSTSDSACFDCVFSGNYSGIESICCSDDCLGRICAYFKANDYESECHRSLRDGCFEVGLIIPCAPTVGFTLEFYKVEETAAAVVLTIVSTGSVEETAVLLTTLDDTAVAPGDYEAVTLNVTFPPGEYIKNVSVPIISDNITESDETFLCVLSVLQSPSNRSIFLDPSFATIVIKNIEKSTDPTSTDTTEVDSSSSDVVKPAVGVSVGVGVGILFVLIGIAVVIKLLIIRQKRSKKDEFDVQLCENQSSSSTRNNTYVGMNQQQSDTLIKLHPTKVIPSSRIRLLDSIGEGEFGVVYKAHLVKNIKGMPDTVAVKTLKHYYNAEESGKIIEEGLRMIDFQHPNVLGLIGVCVDAGPAPYLIMPFMGHGNLLSFLKKRRPELDISKDSDEEKILDVQKRLLDMCLQIAKGMEYLASQNLVHRDLAARNCMLDMNYVIKVADFGLSEDVYTRAYFRQGKDEKIRLPVKWMAPESLHDGIFRESTDIWSFGVTCWETFNGGRNPYPGIDPFSLSQLLMKGKRMDKPNNAACSDEIYEMMLDCWKDDPEERPLFSHLVVSIDSILEQLGGYMDFGTL